ncbi:START domain-containing protein 10 [Mortierella sp. 14UC]|nr:START domain-containing protein 10 [Mortierella sp. 14UC]
MGDSTQSPLAMLVLVTPYTILYLVNQLFLNGILDKVHYVFFELIFVLAFRKLFGLPDLSERLFPAQVAVQTVETLRPLKTSLANGTAKLAPVNGASTIKKKTKKTVTPKASATTTTAPSITTAVAGPKKAKKKEEQPYAKELVAMEMKFMDYINNKDIWVKVFEETSPSLIEVYQYKDRPMCYKIIAVMNNTPAVTFDTLSEVSHRLGWDPLCEEARTLAEVSPGVKVQYVRTKGMWPTSSRDTVILGTIKELDDGRYFNVTSSVEHSLMPERTKDKIVRMEMAVAGQIIGPEPGLPNKCRLVQLMDADLKGWIPEKVIQLVSTKAVPEGIRNVNKMIPSMEAYQESKALKKVIAALKEVEMQAKQEGDNDVEEEENDQVHDLRSNHNQATGSLLNGHSMNGYKSGLLHSNVSNNTVEKKQSSTLRVFWEGFKQSLGYRSSSIKISRVIVVAIVLAVLGPTIARFRRQRR